MRTRLPFLALLLPVAVLGLPRPTFAQWGYPPPVAYGYPPGESSLRISVKPADASVYVDGYFAGKVEDYNGQFQRLHVIPGRHEIVVYREGYHSLKQQLYLSPDSTHTIKGQLEKLGPGDAQDAEPQPTAAPDRDESEPSEQARPMPQPRRPMPPGYPMPRREPPTDQPPAAPRTAPAEPARFATLSIRVEPGSAAILIDGERWDGPSGDERLIVQVPEGHHVIEVEREGYEPFTTEVDARRGQTTPININLRRQER